MTAALRFLVVDDEARGVELLKRTLRKLGQVDGASDADEAWERYCGGHYDLVISDQRMPGTPGVELLERVARNNPFTGRILLTGYAELHSAIDFDFTAYAEENLCRFERAWESHQREFPG